MQPLSPALASAYSAPLQYPARSIDVVPRGATVDTPALVTLAIKEGGVDLDQTRPIRRTLKGLVVPVEGTGDPLVPRKAGDLLHPVSGNEIRVRYGRGYRDANLLGALGGRFDGGLGNWRDWGPGLGNYWGGATSRWGGMAGKISSHPLVVAASRVGVAGTYVGGMWADARGAAGGGQAGAPSLGAAGVPYTMVAWAMPLSRSLSVHVALRSTATGTSDEPGLYVTLPQGVWSAISFSFVPRALGGYSPVLELGAVSGAVAAGDAVAFDALGVFAGAGVDPSTTTSPDAEYSACGFYGLSTPTVDDDDESLSVTLNGQDRAAKIQRARWFDPFQVRRNTTIPEAIRAVLADRWPRRALPLRVDFSACAGHPIMDLTVPNAIFGSDHTAADPWADLTAMATAGGCEIYPNGLGEFAVVPYVQPDTVSPSAWFTDGVNASNFRPSRVQPNGKLLAKLSRALDLSKTYSGVVVTGGSSTDLSCRAEWWDTDPDSPTYVESYGYEPAFYDSPLIRHTGQARLVAQALGARLRMGAEILTFDTIPCGAYEGSDGLFVSRPRAMDDGTFLLEKLDLDLADDPKLMTVASRLTNAVEGVTIS